MRSRAQELLNRSIAAMLAAIEVYNKPMFQYRAETFTVLSINAWELLFKAKMLDDNRNQVRCLYVLVDGRKKDGSKSNKKRIKRTSAGYPFTHSLDYLKKKFLEKRLIAEPISSNLDILEEYRNDSVHFYNSTPQMAARLQEVGMASVKNYSKLISLWFNRSLSEFDFFLMPLALTNIEKNYESLSLKEEAKFFSFLSKHGVGDETYEGDYSVAVNIEVKFSRSKSDAALAVQLSNDKNAIPVTLTEEQIRDKYKYTYDELTAECRKRYASFLVDAKYHKIRKSLEDNSHYAYIRLLDPKKIKSGKKFSIQKRYLTSLASIIKRKRRFDRHSTTIDIGVELAYAYTHK